MDTKLGTNHHGKEVTIDIVATSVTNGTKNESFTGMDKHFLWFALENFHAGYFRISLSLCAQVWLWKTLLQFTKYNHFHDGLDNPTLHSLPSIAHIFLWSLALAISLSLSLVYALRCFHHFDEVKVEFYHHIAVNYLFAPWMSSLLLLQFSPFTTSKESIYQQVLWWVFLVPIIVLDIKIYGQWFIKGKQFLSRVANPTSQLSVIANLVGAKAAIYMGWMEVGLCLFSLGMVHYLVLFVTLYQRLPGNNGVSMILRPVFFLFIATPSMASLAWSSITGTFDNASKMLFFLSFFLFMSLVCRPVLFKKSMKKFNVAWWAYSFPLTLMALASMEYAQAIDNAAAHMLAVVLSVVSILVSFLLMVFTTVKFNRLFLCSEIKSSLV